MAWVIRLAKLALIGVAGYYVLGYIVAALVALLVVWWLLASESAVLGD